MNLEPRIRPGLSMPIRSIQLMPLTGGQTFAGYRIVRLLGSGGMGEVYLAEHPRLPRRDALKVLPADVSADPDYRARFNREADLASKLWHPHIVSVHDRGESEGQLWISMDYVDGLDAARLLASRYPAGMPLDQVVRIVSAVASALDYAHKQGLLHRDVKPANIMLTHVDDEDEQRILLADFGIARNVDDISGLTATNFTVGTVAYAAPEQLMGEHLDGRADQYALAATAYHLLSGSQLFPNTNPAVVIGRHLNAPPPALAETRPQLAVLDPVLAIALAKNAKDRFSRCSAFARGLESAGVGGREDRRETEFPEGWWSGLFRGAGRFIASRDGLVIDADASPPPPPHGNSSAGTRKYAESDRDTEIGPTVAAGGMRFDAQRVRPSRSSRRWLIPAAVLAVPILVAAVTLTWHPWRQGHPAATATMTSESPSAVPASSNVAAAPLPSPNLTAAPAATQTITAVAVVKGQPANGYREVPSTDFNNVFDCDTSPAAVDSGIYLCAPWAARAVACWPSTSATLLCGDDPWTKELHRFSHTDPLPAVKPPATPMPFALLLDDGAQCRIRIGGAWGVRDDGLTGAYGCNGADSAVLALPQGSWALDAFDRSGPLWTVKVGPIRMGNLPAPQTRTVTTAWFAGN